MGRSSLGLVVAPNPAIFNPTIIYNPGVVRTEEKDDDDTYFSKVFP